MAQWRKIQSLAKSSPEVASRLTQIYKNDRKYLLDIRQSCADWMERIDWLSYDVSANGMIHVAQRHFQDLLNTIDSITSQLTIDIVKKITLGQAKQALQEHFSGNLLNFLEVIQACLREEKLLIQSCEPSDEGNLRTEPNVDRAQENHEVAEKLRQLSVELQVAERELAKCTEMQNQFKVEYNLDMENIGQMKTQIESMQPGPELDRMRQDFTKRQHELQSKITTSFQRRMNVSEKHVQVSQKTKQMVEEVWREIDIWNKDKKMEITGISKPKDGMVDVLDKMCNQMNQILMQLLAQFDKLVRVMSELKYSNDTHPDMTMQTVQQAMLMTEQLLKLHLEKVFVVDRNPPRVLKVITGKSLGFAMSCRILGGHALGLQMNPPHVTAELHKEQDVVAAQQQHAKRGMCTVVNGQDKIMEFHRETKQWVAMFNSVQLQSVKQLEKNNDRLVMENMNGMIFYTVLKIRGKDYKLSALSLPMVLISHVLQDCQARAFLIWDAAFSEDDTKRRMFDHPEQVAWHRVGKVLSALFKDNTGRGLKDEHLNYLGRIAFKERKQPDPAALRDRKITKNQLIKDRLQKDFQFWKWFYANMNLIKERLKQEWQDELIYGFIAKDETIRKLKDKPAGTFMLRFSESDIENSNKADICGCLTLAVLETDPESENMKVYHVKEHLTPKDIFERGLATTLEAFEVKDFETGQKRPLLTQLYPERDFRQTFNKYILQKRHEIRDDGSDGYKAGQLRIEIFLADLPDTHRRRQVSIAHALPMSPTPSVPSPAASDMTSNAPMSPGTFPMSPNESMDDSSQMGNGAMAMSVDGGKRLKKAIGIVQPQSTQSGAAVMRQMSTSSTSSVSSTVNDMNNMRIGPATPQAIITSQTSMMSPPHNTMAQQQQQQTPMLSSFTGMLNSPATPNMNAQLENIYANTGPDGQQFIVESELEISSGGLPGLDDQNALENAVDYFGNLNSGDIPIDSGGSTSGGSGSRIVSMVGVRLANNMVMDEFGAGDGQVLSTVMPTSVQGFAPETQGDLELSPDLYGFNLGPTQPPRS